MPVPPEGFTYVGTQDELDNIQRLFAEGRLHQQDKYSPLKPGCKYVLDGSGNRILNQANHEVYCEIVDADIFATEADATDEDEAGT